MADLDQLNLRNAELLEQVLRILRGDEQKGKAQTALEGALKGSTSGLRMMKASTHSVSNSLGGLARAAESATAIAGLSTIAFEIIDSFRQMNQTYRKLTDVGQRFGGSIFKMEQVAGASGLSLEQFARSVERSSILVSQMGDINGQGAKAFMQYQTGVRDSLKQFGYYGMSLSQVTDATDDYAETLRENGQWEKMSNLQRRNSTVAFIKDIASMSAAAGKSREELLKIVNEAERNPVTQAIMSQLGPKEQAALDRSMSVLGAIGSGNAGKTMTNWLSQTIASRGMTWNTDFGKAAIHSGMSAVNPQMESIANEITKNGGIMTPEVLQRIQAMRQQIGGHLDNLNWLAQFGDPQTKEGAMQMITWFNETRGFDPVKFAKKQAEAAAQRNDGFTQDIEMFETNLHALTGALRDGFFGGLVSMIPGADSKQATKQFADELKHAQTVLKGFGRYLGKAVGALTWAVPIIEWTAKKFVSALTGLKDAIEWFLDKFSYFRPHDVNTGKRDANGNPIVDHVNRGNALASFLAVITGGALLWGAKRKLGSWMRMEASTVNINARSVNLGALGNLFGGAGGEHGTGFGAGAQGELNLGEEVAGGAVRKGKLARWFGPGSKFFRWSGFLGRALVGASATWVANKIMDAAPDFAGKQQIEDLLDVGVFAYGPQIAGGIVKFIGKRLGMSIGSSAARLATAEGGGALASALAGFAPMLSGFFAALLSPVVLIPALLAAGLGYMAYKGANALNEHQKKGDWYIDQTTNAAAPLADDTMLDPNTGLPRKIQSSDGPLGKKYLDDLKIEREDQAAGRQVPSELLQEISNTLKQLREQSAAHLELLRKNNKLTQDAVPSSPFAFSY